MDAILAVLTILQNDTGVINVVGSNIFGGQLPEHYNPEVTSTAEPAGNGPAITLVVKGGDTHYEIPLQEVDVQVTTWAGVNENGLARSVYNAVLAALDELIGVDTGAGGLVKRIHAGMPGQDIVDADTGWVMNVSAFHVMLMDSTPSSVNDIGGFDDDYSPYQVGYITGLDGGQEPQDNFS
jgi:hypothetical protein